MFGKEARGNPAGPKTVVKALSAGENGVLCLNSGAEALQMDKLTFKAAKEVFGDSVVINFLQEM